MVTAFAVVSCDDTDTIYINNHCRGGRCADMPVVDPDASDSEDGNHNSTEPNSGNNGDDGDEKIEDQEPSPDDGGESMPCEGKDDCAEVPETCDICQTDSRKCDGSRVYVCRKNAKGCLDWQLETDCSSSGGWCDDSSRQCAFCSEVCSPGVKKCTDMGVSVCTPDGHGCAAWKLETPCGSEKHCDEMTLSCVSGCVSVCEYGYKKCEQNHILSCQKTENGCLSWAVQETCREGMVCAGDPPACDEVCGDECQPFSIVILPDTQNYAVTSTGIHKKQTQWIADNRERENIKFVMHMGDVSDNNRKTHFERAVAAQNVLVKAGIPFSISTGNHDYKEGDSGVSFLSRDRSLFPRYFNDAYFQNGYEDSSWFHGFYHGANMYATFSVGHLKFAVIALEFFPRKDSMCWAERLISNELRDHYVILTTHGYLTNDASSSSSGKYSSGSNGDIPFGAMGTYIWSELASRHSNIIMVACGHVSDSEHRDRTGNTGNKVHETLVDYQSEKPCTSGSCSSACGAVGDAGNGWMRILRIEPVNSKNPDGTLKNNVSARTFSVLETYENGQKLFCSSINASSERDYYSSSPANSDHNYEFAFDFTTPLEYRYSNGGSDAFTGRNVNRLENDSTDGNQYRPALAVNRESGGFVSVWEDDADKSGVHTIQARIFCAGGCSDIEQFSVASGSISQQNPDVAMDGEGNFVVVWQDASSEIFMRGFDASGRDLFSAQKVSQSEGGVKRNPAVAVAPDGSFVVAWEDASQNADRPQIMMRGFHRDASERFPEQNVSEDADGKRVSPDIACDADGFFVVTWQDDSDMNDVWQIKARGFLADATVRIAEFEVNTVGAGQQINPAIGMNESGRFFIAFEDDNDGNGKYLIMARGFDKSGTEILHDTTLSASNEETADPTVCVARDGKAVFGWTAKALNSGDIQKRIVTSKLKIEAESTVNTFTPGPQTTPDVACSADGRYVFVYSDDKPKSGWTNILARGF